MKNSQLKKRLELAIAISESIGQALLKFRESKGLIKTKFEKGGQLKSPIDVAAESWIRALLESNYPSESFLSEESYEKERKFDASSGRFWIIDALDGTRSFHEGYNGFCVQIAFIENKKLKLAVVHAPALRTTYWAVAGKGAFMKKGKQGKRIFCNKNRFDGKLIYTDSHLAKGIVKEILNKLNITKFLEMGSFGIKICKVAEGKANIFLKPVEFKIWDTAPGDLILREAGGKLTLWSGEEIDYSGGKIYFKNLLATNSFLHKQVLSQIKYFHKNN